MKTIWLVALLALPACATTNPALQKKMRTDIQSRVTGAEPALARCYGDALAKNQSVTGKMTVSFEAMPDTGRFKNVKVTRSSMQDTELRECVKKVISTLRMHAPPPKKVVIRSYPIEFKPSQTQ